MTKGALRLLTVCRKSYFQVLKQAALRQSRHFVPCANAKAFAFVLIQRKPPTRVSLLHLRCNSPFLRFANAEEFRTLRSANKGCLPLETRSLFEKSSAKTFAMALSTCWGCKSTPFSTYKFLPYSIWFFKSEADCNGVINECHNILVEMPHFFFQSFLVKSSYLLKQNNGIAGKTVFVRIYFNMCRQLAFAYPAGNCSGYNSRTVLVSDIVLNNENRSYSALLGAYNGTQVRIINISSSDIQFCSLSDFYVCFGLFFPTVVVLTYCRRLIPLFENLRNYQSTLPFYSDAFYFDKITESVKMTFLPILVRHNNKQRLHYIVKPLL